ncbi:hypothetical protein [Caudoviricetes sp.]|nr:hypothetical protein [Caudoviricetes sp.]
MKSILFTRKQAYQQVFNIESIHARRVLVDLARFCRANTTTFHENDRAHAVLEGRREVWLRIQNHINLDPDEFTKTYGKGIE